MSPKRRTKRRIVTLRQLEEGYVTFAGGTTMRHDYKVIGRTRAGDYIVKEPKPDA